MPVGLLQSSSTKMIEMNVKFHDEKPVKATAAKSAQLDTCTVESVLEASKTSGRKFCDTYLCKDSEPVVRIFH